MNAALAILHHWLAPLNLSPTARDATIAAAMAVVARPLYAGPMPATYITGPAGAGKTRLAEQLAGLAGVSQMTMTAEISLRRQLAMVALDRPTVAVVDNLDRAPRMSAAADLCDNINLHEGRALFTNHTTPIRTSWIITSRTLPPTPELARRCILIDLTGSTSTTPAPIDRRTLLGALYTLLGALYTLLGAALPVAADPPPPVGGPCDAWFAILAAAGIPATLASRVTP